MHTCSVAHSAEMQDLLASVLHPARSRQRQRTPASAKAFRSTTENRARHRRNRQADIACRRGSKCRQDRRYTLPSCRRSPAFNVRCGVKGLANRFCLRWLKKMSALSLNCSLTVGSTGASTTTDCSEAQIVPLSKHVLVKISATASRHPPFAR